MRHLRTLGVGSCPASGAGRQQPGGKACRAPAMPKAAPRWPARPSRPTPKSRAPNTCPMAARWAPPRSPCPSAGWSGSPHPQPIPISALKSGCRRRRSGTANSRAKVRAAAAGAISTGAMLEALKAGFATMSTDNGHVTDTKQPNGGSEQTWALGHPEKMLDFAFRAMHLSTIAGKAVTRGLLWPRGQAILFRRLLAGRPSCADGSQPLSRRL